MQPFISVTAVACPLPIANIDTDQLIPARFMRRSRADGYGNFLFHDLRQDAEGKPREFPLNDPAYAKAEVVIARRNFGCGSSREAAVYALADYGIRAVIAPSFGDIFASNAIKNGLLPARVSEEDAERLIAAADMVGARAVTVDLASQTITAGNLVLPFAIDPVWKQQLLNGWDDIDLTLAQSERIENFTAADRKRRPWMAPAAP
jgi:3-isopropylmalate/(R)-2-methylmalate dehydratase small subunit